MKKPSVFVTYDFVLSDFERHKYIISKLDFLSTLLPKLHADVTLDSNANNAFDRQRLFNLFGKSFDPSYLNHIDIDLAIEGVRKLISAHVCGYDYVIAFELSEQTKTILNELGVKYIDIWLSPIRFYKDFTYCFFSNCKETQTKLMQYELSDDALYDSAKAVSSHIQHFLPALDVKPNSALIIGQLSEDKSVLKDGRFLSLVDFYDEIEQASNQYNTLYVLKHPLMSDAEFAPILDQFSSLENLILLDQTNTYQLLSCPEIRKVFAISSSVLMEAKYFGKATHYFYKPVLDDTYVNVYQSYYQSDFWEHILGLEVAKELTYLTYHNHHREAFSTYYAMEQVYGVTENKSKDRYDFTVKLFNLLACLDKDKRHIIYGYGSVGKLIAPHLPNLVGVIDQALDADEIDGYKVLSLNDLPVFNNVTVIITPFLYESDIVSQLKNYTNNLMSIKYME